MIIGILFFLASFTTCFSEEIDLKPYEKSVYSQNGEDGVLRYVLQSIKPKTEFLVDLGAGDGVTNSNTYLLRLQGWTGVLLDREHEMPVYGLYKEFITIDNINDLFDKYKVPTEFDLLSIDVHYNNFHLWQALDPKYQPAVVVIGYNAAHPPEEDKIVRYRPFYLGDQTDYFGATILALYHLGRSKGYSLIYADKTGTNLFFVRDDLVDELKFKEINQVDKIYRPRAYPPDKRNRAYVTSKDLL